MIDELLEPLGTSLIKQWGHCYLVKDTTELMPCIHCSMDSSLKLQLYKFQSDFDSLQTTAAHLAFFSMKLYELCLMTSVGSSK